MLPCVRLTWTNILAYYIYFFVFNEKDIIAAPLKKDNYEKIRNTETGFDLNKEDMTKFHIWSSGIIPYYIDDVSFDKVLRDRIRIFLENVNILTGLRFLEIPRPPEDQKVRWVLFLNRKGLLGCTDHPFKNFTNEGVQRVVLGYHCLNTDKGLADIILSLVGVPPQHNSPDRDKHLIIMKQNILPDKQYLFEKLTDKEWLFHKLGHDFQSAGHYSRYKYTLNGSATFNIKNCSQSLHHIDSREKKGFSDNDILKIKMLYKFISRNREYPLDLPMCSKLFKPGSKLPSALTLQSKYKIRPIPKPSRYLGFSDEKNINKEENDNELIDNNDSNEEKTNNVSDKSNNEENNDTNNNDSKDDNETETGNENKNIDTEEKNNPDKEKTDEEKNYTDENISNENDKSNNEENNDPDYNKAINNKETDQEAENNETEKIKNNDQSNKIEDNTSALNKDSKIKRASHENSEVTNTAIETNDNKNQITKNQSGGNTKRNKERLAYKLDAKKLKLLGESDYETGDEGKKMYIHEKNI